MQKCCLNTKTNRKLGYLLYRSAEGPVLPLIVYLHGTDGCGDDLDTILGIESLPSYIEEGKISFSEGAMVIAPQCPAGMNWAMLADEVKELVEFASISLGADKSRVALTGASLGGMGTLDIAIKYPGLFSCLVPVCAKVDAKQCGVLAKLPIWIFHGELDTGMGFSVVEANAVINKAGGSCRLTLLPGEGHEIRWIYHSPSFNVIDWMLSQRRA